MKLTKVGSGWLIIAASMLAAGAVDGQSSTVIRVNAAEIQVGGRVQTQFNTTSVEGEPDGEFLMRRVRFETAVRMNRVVNGRLQADFAGDRASVKDAYLKLDFSPAVQLLAGKALRPFGLIQQTSSTRILPIERGLAIRGVDGRDQAEILRTLGYSDRDIGLQVMGAPAGAPLGLGYAAAVTAGPLAGRTGETDSYQYTARATVRPADGVTIGGSWSSRAFAEETSDDVFELARGNAFEIDAEIGSFAPGLHLIGELAFGDLAPFEDEEFLGAQAWLAYRTGRIDDVLSAIEPIFRASYSRGATEAGDVGGVLLTPGVNLHLGGLNRVMFNFDHWSPHGGGDAEGSFKTQFQLAF